MDSGGIVCREITPMTVVILEMCRNAAIRAGIWALLPVAGAGLLEQKKNIPDALWWEEEVIRINYPRVGGCSLHNTYCGFSQLNFGIADYMYDWNIGDPRWCLVC